ncbi:hypothetical protein JCM11251_005276 [Rhodosporidiobolus azoricus]
MSETHEQNDFEKQAAAMNAPPPKKYVAGLRSSIYVVALFLIFGLATAEMGIWSYFSQHYGNIRRVNDWPSGYVMRTSNLLFFNSLLSMLLALGAFALPLLFQAFMWFAAMVMWITGAGILTVEMPFSASSCGVGSSQNWIPFLDDCKLWVAFEALAWTLFGLTFVLTVAIVADWFVNHKKAKRHYLLGA